MPFFSNPTANTGGLMGSMRRAVAGGGDLSPNQIAGIDLSAAKTAHEMSLIEKVRAEVDALKKGEQLRNDPAVAARFASHSAGLDEPTGARLAGHLRGDVEQPSPADIDDANMAGRTAEPYRMGAPNVSPEARRTFQSAIAATIANAIATGKTTGEGLAKASGEIQGNSITQTVQDAIARGDVQGASARNQGGKLGNQIKLYDNIGSTGATYAPATGAVQADPKANPSNQLLTTTLAEAVAKKKQLEAAAANSNASADLHGVQRDAAKFDLDAARAAGVKGKPPTGYMWGPLNAAGQPTLVKIEGGPVDTGKQLPHGAVKDLAGAGTAVEDTTRLASSFKPQYGGKTILGDLSNKFKRVVGDETGQAQWWQDMDALQNQTRHNLFGSALTNTELAAWEKTSISPRMDAKEIQTNLTRRQEIEARAASKLGRAYEAAGYNKGQIAELLGVGAQYLTNQAPVVPPVDAQNAKGKIAPKAAAKKVVGGKTYVKVGEEWFEE